MAGRKPKPLELKVLEGNPGRRPLPTTIPRPVCDELPTAPPHLDDIAQQEWERIAPGLHAMGLLAGVDRSSLAAYCTAYARWARAEAGIKRATRPDQPESGLMIQTTNGNWVQNPLVGTAHKAASDMVKYAAEFGMTPSARVRLAIEKKEPSSKFGDLIGGAKAG